ncbi:MAG: hemolysin III family protein [Flavobacteriales bacterium TMED191]|nr:MAG: hemolysin III family protein [Flavobacteriales bacterium TMED191]
MNVDHKYLEELLNTISHGIAAIASILGFVILLNSISNHQIILISTLLYSFSLIILYTSSTLYHGVKNKKLKEIFRILDHCSIFILIAGTYTPIALISINGTTGWWIFAIQWSLVLIGSIFKFFFTGKYENTSLLIYIIMGWMIVLKWNILINSISTSALNLLIWGGIIYTTGIIFYVLDSRMKYSHFIWHLFVITGSTIHYIMIFKYVIN